jgi:hypothetical protein
MKEKEPKNAEAVIKDIRRRTKRKFSSEEKIRIVISGLRGDESINTICRKEGIAPALYYRWSKDFIEAAIAENGVPEIINSDQGSQYTSPSWTNYLEGKGIKISMDGKGRATDNIWIERF